MITITGEKLTKHLSPMGLSVGDHTTKRQKMVMKVLFRRAQQKLLRQEIQILPIVTCGCITSTKL